MKQIHQDKLDRILNGEAVVVDDAFLDAIDLPNNVCTIPNPKQVGTLDRYLAAYESHTDIQAFRKELSSGWGMQLIESPKGEIFKMKLRKE